MNAMSEFVPPHMELRKGTLKTFVALFFNPNVTGHNVGY